MRLKISVRQICFVVCALTVGSFLPVEGFLLPVWAGNGDKEQSAPASYKKTADKKTAGKKTAAKKTSYKTILILQRLQNIGKTKWYIGDSLVRLDLPVATIVCNLDTGRAFIYSYKTRRYVEKKIEEMSSQLDLLKTHRRETYSPWKKLNATTCQGQPALTYERSILSGPRPRPKHVTVTETLVTSRDIKLEKRFAKLVNAITGEEFNFGMPLHIERRAHSTLRKDLDKVPYVMLETLNVAKRTLAAEETEIPDGFTAADSVQSMLLVDYDGPQ